MKEEERELTVEDSGVKNGDQVSDLGNYADDDSSNPKNVGLAYRKDDEIDFGHFEIEVSVRIQMKFCGSTAQGWKKHFRVISTWM